MNHLSIRCVLLLLLCPLVSQAAVTEWDFVKGIGGRLEADNQEPTVTFFDVEIFVLTDSPGDATSVTISGGGIAGILPFTQEGNEWFYEQEFTSEAEMDALFPNDANYTITLSGGSLGTLTQAVLVGPRAYSSLPYLSHDGLSRLLKIDPAQDQFIVIADPGNAVDLTVIEIEGPEGEVFEERLTGGDLVVQMGGGTLVENQAYEVYFDHLLSSVQSGANGFGVDGHVYHTAYSYFDLNTNFSSSIIGAWQFGNSNEEGSGVVVFMKDGTFYLIEDGDSGEGYVDGFERGTYTWNEQSGAFVVSIEQDANGEAGLSHPDGSTTVTVSSNQLTYSDSGGSTVLTRVIDEQQYPIVGGWQFGEGNAFGSRALVFLPNGVYYEAQVTGPQGEPDGIEKGTYTWNQQTGDFTATVGINTNGTVGFSDPLDSFNIRIVGDEMLIHDNHQEWRLYLVDPNTPGMAVPQVTHWSFTKSRIHFQSADNTAPSTANWRVQVRVETKLNLDASAMEIRGGNISGSYPLTQIGRVWTFEKDYHSESSMSAEFPAGLEYSIELSDGFLGTMTQTFRIMGDTNGDVSNYPNTPFLIGSKFSEAQNFDSFQNFSLNWNDPGELTTENGEAVLQVFRFYKDEEVYRQELPGSVTQGSVPAGTVFPGHTFHGYLEFSHTRTLRGDDGFGIDGSDKRNAATDFTLATPVSPLAGGWSYGSPSGEGSGVLVFLNDGTYFHVEDVPGASADPDGFEIGEYTWNRHSGVFQVKTERDTNGTVGLSSLGDILTASISGETLSINDNGSVSAYSRVSSPTNEMIGGWQWGDGNEEYGGIFVFMDNGYYFGMEFNDFLGLPLEGGIERGTYTFSEDEMLLTATVFTDTNGELGLSDVDGMWDGYIFNNQLSIFDNRGGYFLRDAEKAEIPNRIGIYEPALENAFRTTLGKASGPILRLDLQRILKMDASGLGIVETSGFEESINMRELDLSNNAIADLWQVGDMRELRILDLSNNQIEDISYLSNLTKLVSLDLSGNLLSDEPSQSADSGQVQMASFSLLESTGVLGYLNGIESLEILKFANNNISDLDVLNSLPALVELDLSGNSVVDLTPLTQLPNLAKVSIFDNPVDLSEGSSQSTVLENIVASTGANILVEPPDPNAPLLSVDWDAGSQQFQLNWDVGELQTSTDLNTWTDLGSAQSPYSVVPSDGPLFWRLEL